MNVQKKRENVFLSDSTQKTVHIHCVSDILIEFYVHVRLPVVVFVFVCVSLIFIDWMLFLLKKKDFSTVFEGNQIAQNFNL